MIKKYPVWLVRFQNLQYGVSQFTMQLIVIYLSKMKPHCRISSWSRLRNIHHDQYTWIVFAGMGLTLPRPCESMYFFRSLSRYSNTKYSWGFPFSSTLSTHSNLHYNAKRKCSIRVKKIRTFRSWNRLLDSISHGLQKLLKYVATNWVEDYHGNSPLIDVRVSGSHAW